MGSLSGRCAFRGSQRVWRVGSFGERMGMDLDAVRSTGWIQALSVPSRGFGGLPRWQTFRNEGRLGAHGCLHGPAIVPELVSTALPIRIRYIPLRGGIVRWQAHRDWQPQLWRAMLWRNFLRTYW